MSDILIYDLLTVRAFSAIAIASTLTVVFLTAAVFNSGDSHQNFINIIIVVVYLIVVIIILNTLQIRIKRKEVVTKQPEKNGSSWSLSEDGFEHR